MRFLTMLLVHYHVNCILMLELSGMLTFAVLSVKSVFSKSQIGFIPKQSTTDHIYTSNTLVDKHIKLPKQDLSQWDKNPTETLHAELCKILLHVQRKATNNACRAELGRYPLIIKLVMIVKTKKTKKSN